MKRFSQDTCRSEREAADRKCYRMRKRKRGANFSLWPRSRQTWMLKCQRNGESSFAVSARSIRRKERRARVVKGRGGLGIEGAAEKDRECVCLSRCCLPRSFLRSSINETRMQSRRMSNKYVSYPSPPSLFFRFCRTVVFSSLLAGRLLILFLLDSHVTVSHRCSSSWIFLIPQLMCRLSPHTLTLSHVAPVSPTVFPFGFRTVWSGTKSSYYSRVHVSDSSRLAPLRSSRRDDRIRVAPLAGTSILNSTIFVYKYFQKYHYS